MTDRSIVVYIQSGWMFCKNVKEFLSHRGVEFFERDVSQDKDAMKALEELGIMTTPVTVIDGEIVIGFDRPKLEQLLGGWEILIYGADLAIARRNRNEFEGRILILEKLGSRRALIVLKKLVTVQPPRHKGTKKGYEL